jgi:hypothetical protein
VSVNLKPKEWNLLRDEFRALMRDESVHEDSIEMFLDEQIRRRFGEAIRRAWKGEQTHSR